MIVLAYLHQKCFEAYYMFEQYPISVYHEIDKEIFPVMASTSLPQFRLHLMELNVGAEEI